MSTIAEELSTVVSQLSPREQERVLNFARGLAHPPRFPHSPLPPGTPGHLIAKLRVAPDVGESMEKALTETEEIWPDE